MTNNCFRHNIRAINEIYKLGGNFYYDLIKSRKDFLENIYEAYEGFEHRACDETKMPNLTRIWNLPFNSGGFLYGSSMGHLHPQSDFDVQEIYEFLGYGGMLISSKNETKLYLCGKGDKIIVPPDCMMTILNLNFKELETLDMANPKENESSKDILLKDLRGPMIVLNHTGMQRKNEYSSSFIYSSFLSHKFREKIILPLGGIVKMGINSKYENFKINQNEEIEFIIGSDESDLVNEIFRKRNEFRKYNIEIIEAEKGVDCIGRDRRHYRICDSLERLAISSDKLIHNILGM